MKTKTILIILAGVWVAACVFTAFDNATSSCDTFPNRQLKDLPARCLKFYQK